MVDGHGAIIVAFDDAPARPLGDAAAVDQLLDEAAVALCADCALDFGSLAEHEKAAGVARQKLPERLEIVAMLPKTPPCKVRNDVLRQQFKHATP
ncbi:MAG: hypothetical protein ACT4QA_05445 [Panacagrimonas sp.]